MYREWLAGSGLLGWPLVGLLASFAGFLAVLARAGRGRRDADERARVARLPLADDDVPGAGAGEDGAR